MAYGSGFTAPANQDYTMELIMKAMGWKKWDDDRSYPVVLIADNAPVTDAAADSSGVIGSLCFVPSANTVYIQTTWASTTSHIWIKIDP